MAVNDGLTHYWSGQDLTNSINPAFPATLYGNCTTTADGFTGAALTDYAEAPAGIDIGTGDFAVAVWIKTQAGTPDNADALSNKLLGASGAGFSGWGIGSMGEATRLNLIFEDLDSTYTAWRSTATIPARSFDVWYLFAFVIERSIQRVDHFRRGEPTGGSVEWTDSFLNGGVLPVIGKDYTGSDKLRFGGRPGTTTRQTVGSIGDVRIWDRVVSLAEYQEIYDAGPFGIPVAPSQPPSVHPISGFSHPLGSPSGSRSSYHGIEQG